MLPAWGRKALRWVALVVVGAWALYLVAMNVFVRTRLLRGLLGEDPGSLLVDYASAYSIIPGRVHVEGLSIRGRDSHIEWLLLLDRCDFRVSFRDLARRRFHADGVRGEGLSLRVRQRRASFEPAEAAALPPVPGFSDPPYAGPPPPPLTDENYRLWSVWLEGVVADHVREIWIDTIRYTGDLQVHGRWFFRPVRWLDVGPATVDARRLEVSYGSGKTWVSGATGHLQVTVHPFDVRALEGAEILRRISVEGDMRGEGRGAAVVNHALAGAGAGASRGEGVRAGRADLRWEARVAVDHGVLAPGLRLRADRFEAEAHGAGLDFEGAIEAGAWVDDGGAGRADLEVRDLRVSRDGDAKAGVARVAVALASRELDLVHPFADTSYVVDVEGARTESLRYWQQRFGVMPGVTADAALVEADGHGDGTWAAGSVEARARLEARRLSLLVAVGREGVRGARVVFPRVTAIARRAVMGPGGVSGRVVVDAPDVEIPSLAGACALLPLPADVSVDGGVARGAMHVDLDLGEGTVEGWANLAARGVRVRAGPQTLDGDLDASLQATRRGHATDVSGTAVRFRGPQEADWWASAELRQALLSTQGGGARLRARVVARARDAGPFVGWIQSRADLGTKIALAIIPTAGLEASGEVLLSPAALQARSFRAQAEGFDLALEFAELGRTRTCALLLDMGPVRAGVDMTDGRTRVMLFGAEPWFAARVAALRALERRSE